MPRKSSSAAETRALQAQQGQWRYLVRSPEFQKALGQLRNLFRSNQFDEEKFLIEWETVANRYGIGRIPLEVIGEFDSMDRSKLESYADTWGISFVPVFAEGIKDDRFLSLTVDLNHPVDDLLPIIEKLLRDAVSSRPRKRRRSDKVEFNCQVYDLAKDGKTFSEIARLLGKRLSTVKSAYITASRHIFGEALGKKTLPLVNFNPKNHCQSCVTCSKATTPDELCVQAKYYTNQDAKAQRETTGHDTIGENNRRRQKSKN